MALLFGKGACFTVQKLLHDASIAIEACSVESIVEFLLSRKFESRIK